MTNKQQTARALRVNIKGDGTVAGTKVYNAETGELLPWVQSISFKLDVDGGKVCTIEQVAIIRELDITTEAFPVQREPQEGEA